VEYVVDNDAGALRANEAHNDALSWDSDSDASVTSATMELLATQPVRFD